MTYMRDDLKNDKIKSEIYRVSFWLFEPDLNLYILLNEAAGPARDVGHFPTFQFMSKTYVEYNVEWKLWVQIYWRGCENGPSDLSCNLIPGKLQSKLTTACQTSFLSHIKETSSHSVIPWFSASGQGEAYDIEN